MLDFLTTSNNLPFAVALAMMLMLSVLELLSFLFGASVSGFLDGLFDFDFDFEAGDADGSELAGHSLADRFMGWLHFGKVPVLILFATFLVSFGGIGLILQGVLRNTTGFMLPGWLAALAVFPLSLPAVRVFGSGLAKVLPKDETEVVSQESMVGRVATIVIGEAAQGSPAQARVRDARGRTHYVMLEPDEPGQRFKTGDSVLLIARSGAVFRAIRSDSPALSNPPT
ncbi:MAG: YqiJ family protein [Rhodanobacteraceae bacterium]|nr:YqiJ family protein [Xanthomonadales bacterium]MCP5479300.1 YqiJ family protein [Rhodanobacteraceae bacterium]HPF74570.1 YqiJ family protein [Xanthomonadaceae bacterium]HRX98877.1 YqiJ family protein [Xanthomonadaceae bacterium]